MGSPLPDTYATVAPGETREHRVKGSRFLAQVQPVQDQAHAATALQSIRKSAFDATHHCWATRLGSPLRLTERSDDDGEPSGTAGRPILGALQRHNVYGALLVVTRYFGGTKLGPGGLARAYGEAAELVLASTPQPTVWLRREIRVTAPYPDLGAVEAELARAADLTHRVTREFGSTARFTILVPRSQAAALAGRIFEACAGRARVDLDDPEAA